MNHPLNPMTDPSGYPMNHPINLTDNPIGLKSAYLTDGSSDIRIDQIRIAPLYVTIDICLSPQYDWYIVLSKISILGFQSLPIQKIFPWAKKSRENERNQ